MKDTGYLMELDKLKQEQLDKAEYLKGRFENGTLSPDSYQSQMRGVSNTIDLLNNQIEDEIKEQGLSEQEYQESKAEWRQEEEHDR